MREYDACFFEIRRNRDLIKKYRGAQPADNLIKKDIDAAFRFLSDDDMVEIKKITVRMRGNLLPPNAVMSGHEKT